MPETPEKAEVAPGAPLTEAEDGGNGAGPPAAAPPTGESRAERPPEERISTFHALRYRDFRLLWAGSGFMSAAQWMQITTMGWLSYDLTGSGSLVGAVSSVGNLTTPFVAPFSGLASDRYNRKLVVALSQALLFVNAVALAAVIALGWLEVWHLFAFALVGGTLNAFNMPARQTLVFDVVPRDTVPNAVALNNLAFSTMRTVGPMLGGGLIALFGPANNFHAQALAYALVAMSAAMIRTSPRPVAPRRTRLIADMVEGYAWALKNQQARLLLLMLAIYPTFIIPLHNALMPIFAKDVFDSGASGLGILLSALGAGGIVGGLLTASLNQVDRRGLLQLNAIYVCSLGQMSFALLGWLTGNLWVGTFLLFLAGIGGAIFNTTNQTVVQLIAPDHMRGRIASVMQIQPLCMAAGTMAAGAMADVIGAVATGALFNFGAFAVAVGVLLFSPQMRALRFSRLGEPARA